MFMEEVRGYAVEALRGVCAVTCAPPPPALPAWAYWMRGSMAGLFYAIPALQA